MSVLQDKSTRQVALIGGVAVLGVIALAARRRRASQTVETAEPGTLAAVSATPGCTDLVPSDAGWLLEINDQVVTLTQMEIDRATAAGEVANPARASQKLLRMISPSCPVPPPREYPMYSWYEAWTKQSYDLMRFAGLQPGSSLLPDWTSYLATVVE